MMNNTTESKRKKLEDFSVLVPVDFSPFSVQALRFASTFMGHRPSRLIALHVIDAAFVDKCIQLSLAPEDHIKKTLFTNAKAQLKRLLIAEEMENAERNVCIGTPFLEINKQAIQHDADMIIMGSRGNSGDMNSIFFGSTTERVLRFIKRPVLCVPLEES